MKKKLAGLVAIVAILLLVLICVGLINQFILQQSPKYLYMQAELNNARHMAQKWQAKYEQEQEIYHLKSEQPSRTELQLAGNFQFQGLLGQLINQQLSPVQATLAQSKLLFRVEEDPQIAHKLLTLGLASAEDSPYTFSYLLKNTESKQSWSLAQMLSETISMETELGEHYREHILQHLSEGMFSLEKVEISTPHSQNNLKAKKITLLIHASEANEFFHGLLELVEREPVWQGWLAEQGLTEVVTKGLVQVKQLSFPEGLTMQVLLDEHKNILARELSFTLSHPLFAQGVQLEYASRQQISKESAEGYSWQLALKCPNHSAQEVSQLVREGAKLQNSQKASQPQLLLEVEQKSGREEGEVKTQFSLTVEGLGAALLSKWSQELAALIPSGLTSARTDSLTSLLPKNLNSGRLNGQMSSLLENIPFVEIPRLHGHLVQRSEQHLATDSVHQEISAEINIDMASAVIGKQSLQVQLELQKIVEFTEEVFIPMIEGKESLPLMNPRMIGWPILRDVQQHIFQGVGE